jgi:hypothetical protein
MFRRRIVSSALVDLVRDVRHIPIDRFTTQARRGAYGSFWPILHAKTRTIAHCGHAQTLYTPNLVISFKTNRLRRSGQIA